MSEFSSENRAVSAHAPSAEPQVVAVASADDSRFELLCVLPPGIWHDLLYWIPAMGMPARHYLPLATALAAQGVAVVLHEWRGIGSSNRRAGRADDWGYRELLQDDLSAGTTAVRERWPQARCWLGGHSLGGQLGAMFASLHPLEYAGLVLVASGAPNWRCFRYGRWLGAAYVLAPWLARLVGHLPGRRIGFAGNEARGVIADWARTGCSGRYAAKDMAVDFERQLALLQIPVLALRLHDDWFGPAPSLSWLLDKMPQAARTVQVITSSDLDGHAADHFSWMKTPEPIARRIAGWLSVQDTLFTAHDPARA